MKYDPDRHHRQSIRLRGYDYTQAGAYFVTIVTQGRECLFGDVVNDEMQSNDAGRMVLSAWEALPQRFPGIELDEFGVMPNHVHGIIVVAGNRAGTSPVPTICGGDSDDENDVGATLVVALDVMDGDNWAGTSPAPTSPTLGAIVGAFKSITTNEYIRGVHDLGWPPFDKRIWQRNYFERIIRDERELNRIREYIVNNPLKWALDTENPDTSKGEASAR